MKHLLTLSLTLLIGTSFPLTAMAKSSRETPFCKKMRESTVKAYEKAGEDEEQLARVFAPLATLSFQSGCNYKKLLRALDNAEPEEDEEEQ